MTEPWFLNPEFLAEIEISKNEKGAYRVRSHPLDTPKHAKSEEIIRQIVLAQLRCHYHYPQELLSQEHIIQMGIAKKRADIVVLGENSKTNAIIEVKLKFDENAVSQLQSYMMASGARFGAVIALDRRKVFRRNDEGDFVEIPDLPIHNCDMHLLDNNYRVMPATLKSRVMIDSLGIKSLLKISSTKSELIFQKGSIIISDAALLSYNLIRKAAISKGIFLSSAISNNEWDAILEILVEEQVPENQAIKWAKKEDVFLTNFSTRTANMSQVVQIVRPYSRSFTKDSLFGIEAMLALVANSSSAKKKSASVCVTKACTYATKVVALL